MIFYLKGVVFKLAIAYLMVGIPGSGKTTYTKKIKNAKYLGTDSIRIELFNKELSLRGHNRVHKILHAKMWHYLNMNTNVIVDCMNITRKQRKILLNEMPKNTKVIVICMNTGLCKAILNNRKRQRHVPILGIIFFHLIKEMPKKCEGFSGVIMVNQDQKSIIDLVVYSKIQILKTLSNVSRVINK